MTTTAVRPGQAEWLFEDGRHQPLTPGLLAGAGLPSEPLAGVWLRVARVGRAGTWHLAAPADGPAGTCPGLRRAAARGRAVTTRRAGVLDGLRLCRWCTTTLTVPGPEGTYLTLARRIVAADEWVRALEDAAPSAGWLEYARWTARTPFTDPTATTSALLAALPPGPAWEPCRASAGKAWQQLSARAEAAWEHARQTAGPPGLRAMAAAACATTGADRQTAAESRLIAAVTTGTPWLWPAYCQDAWHAASSAWLDAICPDADPGAAQVALHAAIEDMYAESPVRDVSLLPDPASSLPGEHGSPAAWARAEYRALRQEVAAGWCQRLESGLAGISQADGPWRLVLVAGWPLTGDRDRELAYLASYPELGRILDAGCGAACGREHPSWAVVLHLPGFAAGHAAAHDSPHLHVVTGPALPAGVTPGTAQVDALLRHACDLDDNPATPTTPLTKNAPATRRSRRS